MIAHVLQVFNIYQVIAKAVPLSLGLARIASLQNDEVIFIYDCCNTCYTPKLGFFVFLKRIDHVQFVAISTKKNIVWFLRVSSTNI